jgi:hypothetical protein
MDEIKEGYPIDEYPDIAEEEIEFPEEIHIAYAVCGNSCGVRGFIVDGQTQVCQSCGKLMFRTYVKTYLRKQ